MDIEDFIKQQELLPDADAARLNKALDLYTQGKHCYSIGRDSEAISLLEQSFSLDPVSRSAQLISASLEQLGDVDGATEWIGKAYSASPNNDLVATAYARLEAAGGRMPQAINVLQAVLVRNAVYGPARNLLMSLNS